MTNSDIAGIRHSGIASSATYGGIDDADCKDLSRRSVTTGLTATVMAIPAIGLVTSATGDPSDGPLLEAIGRYQAEIAAVNASHGLTDDELDAWVDRADAILMEAVGLPVLTASQRGSGY
jgi:hypothetical protein